MRNEWPFLRSWSPLSLTHTRWLKLLISRSWHSITKHCLYFERETRKVEFGFSIKMRSKKSRWTTRRRQSTLPDSLRVLFLLHNFAFESYHENNNCIYKRHWVTHERTPGICHDLLCKIMLCSCLECVMHEHDFLREDRLSMYWKLCTERRESCHPSSCPFCLTSWMNILSLFLPKVMLDHFLPPIFYTFMPFLQSFVKRLTHEFLLFAAQRSLTNTHTHSSSWQGSLSFSLSWGH